MRLRSTNPASGAVAMNRPATQPMPTGRPERWLRMRDSILPSRALSEFRGTRFEQFEAERRIPHPAFNSVMAGRKKFHRHRGPGTPRFPPRRDGDSPRSPRGRGAARGGERFSPCPRNAPSAAAHPVEAAGGKAAPEPPATKTSPRSGPGADAARGRRGRSARRSRAEHRAGPKAAAPPGCLPPRRNQYSESRNSPDRSLASDADPGLPRIEAQKTGIRT